MSALRADMDALPAHCRDRAQVATTCPFHGAESANRRTHTSRSFHWGPGAQASVQRTDKVKAQHLHAHHSERRTVTASRDHYESSQLRFQLDRFWNPSGPVDCLLQRHVVEIIRQGPQGSIERFGRVQISSRKFIRLVDVHEERGSLVKCLRLNLQLG